MKKTLALLAALLLPFAAAAHGPSPLKSVETVTIKAPAAKVWALVSDFGAWEKWHPAVKSTKVEEKDGSTFRTLNLQDGGTIVERLKEKSDTDMQLKYEIIEGVVPVTSYNSKITVKDNGNGETTVEWFGRYYRKYVLNPPIPAGEDDESASKAVNGIYQSGLANLKKVAEGN
jgi:mxaD protein